MQSFLINPNRYFIMTPLTFFLVYSLLFIVSLMGKNFLLLHRHCTLDHYNEDSNSSYEGIKQQFDFINYLEYNS